MNKRYFIIDVDEKKYSVKDWAILNNLPFSNLDESLIGELLINQGWLYSDDFNEVIILTPEAEQLLRDIQNGGISSDNMINIHFWNKFLNFF
jgi:hypothetical protein